MGEHEEVHDEDVIVVIMNEDGVETYYREEMIIPINNERFAVLVALSAASEEELVPKRKTKRLSQRFSWMKTVRMFMWIRPMKNLRQFSVLMNSSMHPGKAKGLLL